MKLGINLRILGLQRFGLDENSFRALTHRRVEIYVYLQSYNVTPAVRKLPPSRRFVFLSRRVDRWLKSLFKRFPRLSFELRSGKLAEDRMRPSAELPTTLAVTCSATEALKVSRSVGVEAVCVTRIAGYRRRPLPKIFEWYCVRALVVIRVEQEESGLQSVEDRFMLVRASSFDDAKKRLRRQWREYAAPYLNSDGQMVSWQLDHVIDVYQTGETEISPAGTEVYSKLRSRRMRPEYEWRPGPRDPILKA